MSKYIVEHPLRFDFKNGSLRIHLKETDTRLKNKFSFLVWDQREFCYKCLAYRYRSLVEGLRRHKIAYEDDARRYEVVSLKLRQRFKPFEYQSHACDAWYEGKKGVVTLPTGSGKSYLAMMLIEKILRSTLVVVPTLDLVRQWKTVLNESFKTEIGQLAEGINELYDITVTTYDSARIHSETIGNKFCMIVFDECHHLTAQGYATMARNFIAPYRLGLTATPPEERERIDVLDDVSGKRVYHVEISELSGKHLSPYRLQTIYVTLTPQERELYEFHRSAYLEFRNRIPHWVRGGPWERFVYYAYRSSEGRKALKSFAEQKHIAIAASAKFKELEQIILKHKSERILIFTHDNATAYRISCDFLLPLVTHETQANERKKILTYFRSGRWPYLISSKVLNEGVDIPDANVAVIISGSSTVREHVQRLGRILRKSKQKQAMLYELVTENTGEMMTSRKRREHEAYQKNFIA